MTYAGEICRLWPTDPRDQHAALPKSHDEGVDCFGAWRVAERRRGS